MKTLKLLLITLVASCANLVSAASVTSALTASDPTMQTRLLRDGVASTCGSPKAFPGLFGSGVFSYRLFNFMNNGPESCMTFTVSVPSCATAIFATAYGGDFSPTNLEQNYLGDAGSSLEESTFSVNVPANSPVNILINGLSASATGCEFTISTEVVLNTPNVMAPVSISNEGDSQVTVGWTAPANNGSPITKYTVTGVPGGSCTKEIVAPATEPATSCTISGLTNGTPYKFTVVATNANGDSAPSLESAEAIPLADLMFVGVGPNITLASGVVAAAYSQPLQVTGGLPPYTFSVTGDLPPGLELDSATGIVSGTPTTPGTYSFSVMAMDSAVQPTLAAKAVHIAEQTFTIVITAAPVIQATPTPVPALGGVGLLLLSGAVAGSMGLMRRRKSN